MVGKEEWAKLEEREGQVNMGAQPLRNSYSAPPGEVMAAGVVVEVAVAKEEPAGGAAPAEALL